jgi:flagellar hook assembly protein FlgD
LQITRAVPVIFSIYDLSGRQLHTAFSAELGIGPVEFSWAGKNGNGELLLPGTYIWRLQVEADAFEEVHMGTIAVAF